MTEGTDDRDDRIEEEHPDGPDADESTDAGATSDGSNEPADDGANEPADEDAVSTPDDSSIDGRDRDRADEQNRDRADERDRGRADARDRDRSGGEKRELDDAMDDLRETDDRRAARRDPHPHTRPGTPPADEGRDDDHWLSSLLSALERLEGSSSSSASGQHRGDRAIVDYDISIGTPLDSADDDADSPGTEPDRRGESALGDSGDDRPRKRRRRNPSSDHLVTTRREEDELLVTADVAGADPDEVTVGFDDSTLVIAVSGSELDRIDAPWPDLSASAAIKNGVLTVRLTPEGAIDE